MNYEKIYNDLIDKYGTYAKPKDGQYYERHRKIPGHAGGKYVEGNAFYVPARVHYIAHQLLARVTGNPKDWAAVWGMMNQKGSSNGRDYRVTSRAYGSARVACLPAWVDGGKKFGGISGKRNFDKKVGIHAQTREERLKHASAGGKAGSLVIHTKKDEKGRSITALKAGEIGGHKGGAVTAKRIKEDPDFAKQHRIYSAISGNRNAKNKIGFHARTKEQRSEHSKRNHREKTADGKSKLASRAGTIAHLDKDEMGRSKLAVRMGEKRAARLVSDNEFAEAQRANSRLSASLLQAKLADARINGKESTHWGMYQRWIAGKSRADKSNSEKIKKSVQASVARAKPVRDECAILCRQLGIKLTLHNMCGYDKFIAHKAELLAMLEQRGVSNA